MNDLKFSKSGLNGWIVHIVNLPVDSSNDSVLYYFQTDLLVFYLCHLRDSMQELVKGQVVVDWYWVLFAIVSDFYSDGWHFAAGDAGQSLSETGVFRYDPCRQMG